MARIALLAAVVAVAGCTSGAGSQDEPEPSATQVPASLDAVYVDGTIEFRYPASWKRSSSPTFGAFVLDNVSPHPAFVSVRYFADEVPVGNAAALSARTIRPPSGRGLTLLYTQTAFLGGRRGREVAFIWSTRESTPLGPTMRTFVVPLRDGRTALLVFAAERPRFHGGVFRWVRETLRWTAAPAPLLRRPGGRIPSDY